MEILSEWYRDNDVTFLGKPGYGRMDQDHGMGWHGNRSQACLRTSLARIYVRTALIYATRQEWICQITQGLSIALKTGAELKAHPPAPCWSSSTVDCTDKLRQKKKKNSRNGGVDGRWWRFRVGEGTPAHHVRACVSAWGWMAWVSLLRTSQSIITRITATAPYASSSSPPSSSSSSSSPSFSQLKRGNLAGGKRGARTNNDTFGVSVSGIFLIFFELRHHVED